VSGPVGTDCAFDLPASVVNLPLRCFVLWIFFPPGHATPYASVEQRDDAQPAGAPGDRRAPHNSKRGVVMCRQYEARKFGVGFALPSATLGGFCPRGFRSSQHGFLPGGITPQISKSSPTTGGRSLRPHVHLTRRISMWPSSVRLRTLTPSCAAGAPLRPAF